jgi:hypothetical protein
MLFLRVMEILEIDLWTDPLEWSFDLNMNDVNFVVCVCFVFIHTCFEKKWEISRSNFKSSVTLCHLHACHKGKWRDIPKKVEFFIVLTLLFSVVAFFVLWNRTSLGQTSLLMSEPYRWGSEGSVGQDCVPCGEWKLTCS